MSGEIAGITKCRSIPVVFLITYEQCFESKRERNKKSRKCSIMNIEKINEKKY